MSKKITPLDERVLIRIQSEESAMENGIVIPESAKEDYPSAGYVASVGSKVNDLQVGEYVLFSQYAGDDLEVDGVPFKMVPRENVIGILHDA